VAGRGSGRRGPSGTALRLGCALALLLGSIGCGLVEESREAAPASEAVLARVGERTITVEEYRARLRSVPHADERVRHPGGAAALLDPMIEALLLEDAARETGLESDPGFQARRAPIQARAREEESQLRRRMLLERLGERASVSEGEIRELYESGKARFLTTRLHLRQLTVADEASARQALARAADGGDFADLVAELSVDPRERETRGDLGSLDRSEIPPALRTAALQLREPGETSAPFEVDGRWHLVQLVAREDGAERSYESLRPRLEGDLRRRKAAEAYRELLEARRQALGVAIEESRLREFGPPPSPRDREGALRAPLERPESKEAKSEGEVPAH
jgi:hypothetical protein